MNYFGVAVLTDPALFNRVGFAVDSLFTVGPRRITAPPLPPAALQAVQVILITHAHMDHLDLPSLKALPKSATVLPVISARRLSGRWVSTTCASPSGANRLPSTACM